MEDSRRSPDLAARLRTVVGHSSWAVAVDASGPVEVAVVHRRDMYDGFLRRRASVRCEVAWVVTEDVPCCSSRWAVE